MPSCRLIVDPPALGAWNMAVDEALLESVADGGLATLRFYQWSEPTLSLGYFQPYADREQHEASRGLTVVRRSTGGGALIHDHELTYSLALPATNPHTRDATALTCLVHKTLIKAVEELASGEGKLTTHPNGIDTGEMATGGISEAKQDEPFLCFQRRSAGDLLADGGAYKVCGSAQRRRRGALLQHGGVLITRSTKAPELPGLADLTDLESPKTASLIETWSHNLREQLGLGYEPSELTPSERALAEQLTKERFSCRSWIERR